MNLTDEQREIVAMDKPFVLINAFAGCGKTTTMLEYIKERPNKRILDIVFNKSAAESMQKKAYDMMIASADFSTIHSFAYRNMVKIAPEILDRLVTFIPTGVLAKHFGQKLTKNRFALYPGAYTLGKCFTEWCQSDADSIEMYAKEGFSEKTMHMLERLHISTGNFLDCLKKMEEDLFDIGGTLPIVHDAYLKIWQLLSKERDFGYDEIIIDEAQDTTNAVISLVMSQKKAKKIFIGDRFQQIYSWNGCVNSFQKLENKGAENLFLTQSFRCPEEIANRVRPYLAILGNTATFRGRIIEKDEKTPECILCRTNASVFSTLFNFKENKYPSDKICLYGGVKGYKFQNILDIANLASGNMWDIKSQEIRAFKSFSEYSEYVEMIDDKPNRSNCELVKKFGVNTIKKIVGFLEREPYSDTPVANGTIVSTAHKAKGSEFLSVTLADDYFSLLENVVYQKEKSVIPLEEIRLLYVAETRSMKNLESKFSVDESVLDRIQESIAANLVKTYDWNEKGQITNCTETSMEGISTYLSAAKFNEIKLAYPKYPYNYSQTIAYA